MLNLNPQEQSELVGHSEVENELLVTWREERIPNAWIFSGPKGIGKATMAFRLARFILSTEQQCFEFDKGLWVDPNSNLFKRVSAGGHVDLFTLEPSKNERGIFRNEIVVDDVRRLNKFTRLTPGESGWRVIIVDGADKLNRSAENAMLKLLEEASKKTLFILVAHSLNKLLPTTRSRCRHTYFKRLNKENTEKVLLLNPKCSGLNENDFKILIQISEGSPGYGLQLLEQGGIEFAQTIIHLIMNLPTLDLVEVHKLGDRVGHKDGADIYDAVTDIILWTLSVIIRGEALGFKDYSIYNNIISANSTLLMRIKESGQSLDQWAELWDDVHKLLTGSKALNMERKQALINAFTLLARMARD